MFRTSEAIFPSTLITSILTFYSKHKWMLEDGLKAVPAETLRTRKALGDWQVLALGWAAGPRVRLQPPYIFEVGAENLAHAPRLRNTSAGAMGRVAFEDLRRFPNRRSAAPRITAANWAVLLRGKPSDQNKTPQTRMSHGTLSRTALPRSLLNSQFTVRAPDAEGHVRNNVLITSGACSFNVLAGYAAFFCCALIFCHLAF